MKRLLKIFFAVIDDVSYLAGVTLVAIGAARLCAPAGMIAGGLGLILFAVLISRRR